MSVLKSVLVASLVSVLSFQAMAETDTQTSPTAILQDLDRQYAVFKLNNPTPRKDLQQKKIADLNAPLASQIHDFRARQYDREKNTVAKAKIPLSEKIHSGAKEVVIALVPFGELIIR